MKNEWLDCDAPIAKVFDREAVRSIRLEKNLTMKDVSDKIGCTFQEYQKWELGKVIPGANAVAKIAFALNCQINDLFNYPSCPDQ